MRDVVPGSRCFERGVHPLHKRRQIFDGVARGFEDDNGEVERGDILLVGDVPIRGDEGVEVVLRESE
jgi:hypothetical protein